MHSISKNLKKIRTDRGWTQQQMADVLFVTRQTVSSWENGKSMPDLNMLTDISEKLDIDVNILLYGYQKNDTDIRNNMIVSSVLVLSAIISYLWVLPHISRICAVTFCSFDRYFVYFMIFPIFSFSAARWLIQVAKFKNIIPASVNFKQGERIRKVIQISIIIYVVLLAPYVIYEFVFFIVSFSVVVMKVSTGSSLFSVLTGMQNLAGNVLQFMFKVPVYSKVTDFIFRLLYNPKFIAMWLIALTGVIYELSIHEKSKTNNSDKEKNDSSL